MHEPALIAASLTDNDGNVGGSLGSNVKPWLVERQIPVKIPANPYVTKLEGCGDAATHSYKLLLVHPDNKYGNCDRTSN
jgi:hypothetical protein